MDGIEIQIWGLLIKVIEEKVNTVTFICQSRSSVEGTVSHGIGKISRSIQVYAPMTSGNALSYSIGMPKRSLYRKGLNDV